MEWPFFLIFAVGMIAASVMVISLRNVVHSALALLLSFFFVAALYVMLGAEFLAAIQILIYAGAIMMLYVFVIMLVNVREQMGVRQWNRQRAFAFIIAGLLAAEFLVILLGGFFELLPPAGVVAEGAKATAEIGNTEAFGGVLYTQFLFPFEVASLLLLAAMIGAIVLAKREIK